MKIIVFGGKGFLGSHVVKELEQYGHEVKTFDLKDGEDILDENRVEWAVRGQDIVYNFAGLSDLDESISNPRKAIDLNVLGNLNVLEAALLAKVRRFIYASTVYAASDQGSYYGISKACSEKIIKEYKIPYTIIRYGSVYGPGASSSNRIYRLINGALEAGKIVYRGSGEEVREYIHVKDASRLSHQIINPRFENKTIVLTGTEKYKYRDLLLMIKEMFGNKLIVECEAEDYPGHYVRTPYSLDEPAEKLVANPFIDMGQGLIQVIDELKRAREQGEVA